MSRITGSWLSGPGAALPNKNETDTPNRWRGEALGFPQSGPGALAPTGRRLGALVIDWLMSVGIAALIIGSNAFGGAISTVTLGVWALIGIVAVALFGYTPGQFFVGIRVVRLDRAGKVGPVQALFRSLLLAVVVPGLITDRDGRGVQDRATGTAVVYDR